MDTSRASRTYGVLAHLRPLTPIHQPPHMGGFFMPKFAKKNPLPPVTNRPYWWIICGGTNPPRGQHPAHHNQQTAASAAATPRPRPRAAEEEARRDAGAPAHKQQPRRRAKTARTPRKAHSRAIGGGTRGQRATAVSRTAQNRHAVRYSLVCGETDNSMSGNTTQDMISRPKWDSRSMAFYAVTIRGHF